ncbi:glycosyltransferase family protein [Aneurinibacillus uraniidurans]|uniref:glycosyltransferase family protein n=1 Tax=Aneurinibacillus uraniidurans TaxID=2966586 RepID=UPI0023491874|nr:glycosyltransferase family protein [Aneurinibacillus sp. B1]WCN38142.1 glycosyltransferase family protein [Aneurinibacillus sp. B1]
MKTIIIIQARMGSSRLPGKVLKELGDTIVLDYDVSRCREIQPIHDVIVATSLLSQDDTIEEWCTKNDVAVFRGSEHDVLSRYYECAKLYNPDHVIRVTSDCPFVDYKFANSIVKHMQQNPVDVARIEGDLPRGLAIEMLSFDALEYIHRNGHEPRHREHVTYYAYEYADQFTSTWISAPVSMRHPQLRITLDTKEDYALCRAIAENFVGDKLISSQQVVDYLLENPEIAKLNAHIQQKPVI